jgi:hypothetical protein
VQGLPWKDGELVRLPRDAFAANLLCANHNTKLSPVDGEAIKMKNFILDAAQSVAEPRRFVSERYYTVEWAMISRWLAKLVCNVEMLHKRNPHMEFARHAFGQKSTVYLKLVTNGYGSDKVDMGHISIERYPYEQLHPSSKCATVYVIRFASLQWLVASFELTPEELQLLGMMRGSPHWLLEPLVKTREIPIGYGDKSKRVSYTHKLMLRVPERRKRNRR